LRKRKARRRPNQSEIGEREDEELLEKKLGKGSTALLAEREEPTQCGEEQGVLIREKGGLTRTITAKSYSPPEDHSNCSEGIRETILRDRTAVAGITGMNVEFMKKNYIPERGNCQQKLTTSNSMIFQTTQ